MSFYSKKPYRFVCYTLTISIVTFFATGIALAEGQRKLVLDPYANVDWNTCQQHKANLHTHTNHSDGAMSPDVVIQKYRERGYDILALTDHNRCIWPWSKYAPEGTGQGMLAIAGNELSRHHHMQSLFCEYKSNPTVLEESLQGVREAGGISILNHPAMHWHPRNARQQYPAVQIKLTPPLRQITRGDFTVESWFRTTSAGRNILMGNFQGNTKGHLNLELYTDNQVRIYVSGPKTTTDIKASADKLDIDIHDGKWHHLAGIRKENMVAIYLDGKLAGKQVDVAGKYDLQGDTYFIGRDTRAGSTSFEGDLDDVRLWNRALSPEEIQAEFQGKQPGKTQGLSNDGLLAQYTFETEAIGQVDDSAGHAKGPFHATATPEAVTTIINDPAKTLQKADVSHAALRFIAKKTEQNIDASSPEKLIPEKVALSYTNLMESYPHLIGMEVLNGTRPLSEYPFDRGLWDALLMRLMPSRPVWGFSNDDMHGMVHLGRDWNTVLCQKLDEKTVRDTLCNGQFYFSSTRAHQGPKDDVASTPIITRIDHDKAAGTLTISATEAGKPFPSDACYWIADGKVIHIGPTLNYRTTPDIHSYVRAELRGQGGITLTNPFGFSQK